MSKPLLPVFEAVVNAVEAIKERGNDDGLIEITIQRESPTLIADGEDSRVIADISSFEITDNGVGFTEKHFTSFDTSFSTLKADIGGKGVGRLVWLKAFRSAAIESVYQEAGGWSRRTFRFVPTPSGIEAHSVTALAEAREGPHTSVKLVDFRLPYRSVPPKSADAIALRLIEHCLVLYMIGAMPRVLMHDPSTAKTLDLDKVYENEVKHSQGERQFEIRGHEFTIIDAMLRASADAENAIHFCANKREVETLRLTKLVPHAEALLQGEDATSLRYAACVIGPFLDARVNQQRTGFNVDADDGSLRFGGEDSPTKQEIEEAAVREAIEFLEPRLADAKARSMERIESFINKEEPYYRILLEHRRPSLERISGSINDERLELELHKELATWRQEVKSDVAKALKKTPHDAESFEKYKEDTANVLGQLTEVVKADLAEYVHHRRTVLDFMGLMLGIVESGKFAREDVLHGLFFPPGSTSRVIDYDTHNLWVLDERLAFHQFLASDTAFAKQEGSPISIDRKDRPDILIYNHPMSFAESPDEVGSVVIVEFKRPERDDYTATDNPLDQVLEYARQIREGRAVRADGSKVYPPREGTPFYCHIVLTLGPRMRALCGMRGYTLMPDGEGYFWFNETYKAYIEVVDYRKVLKDAVRRNKVFFQKLGLHTGTKRPRD